MAVPSAILQLSINILMMAILPRVKEIVFISFLVFT
jgi:hypothetical protein